MTLAETLLLSLLAEVDFVLRGGDHETCPDCGLGPVGLLRDARNDAVAYLLEARVLERGPDGALRRAAPVPIASIEQMDRFVAEIEKARSR